MKNNHADGMTRWVTCISIAVAVQLLLLWPGVPWIACFINLGFLAFYFLGTALVIKAITKKPLPWWAAVLVCLILFFVQTFVVYALFPGVPVELIPPGEMWKYQPTPPTHWKLGVGILNTAGYAFAWLNYKITRRSLDLI